MGTESQTWLKDKQAEARMEDEHLPFWSRMVEHIPSSTWKDGTVLDFGCNRGGFLRMLHDMTPFKEGIGVDLVEESVATANARKESRPVNYLVSNTLAEWKNHFDCAFSYEVIYLMKDLADHARQIHQALKPGGTYFAATGCHSDNPLWKEWTEIIHSKTAREVPSYSLNDFAEAFHGNGFSVSARRLAFDTFVPIFLHREYFPQVTDSLDYYAKHIIVFSFTKKP